MPLFQPTAATRIIFPPSIRRSRKWSTSNVNTLRYRELASQLLAYFRAGGPAFEPTLLTSVPPPDVVLVKGGIPRSCPRLGFSPFALFIHRLFRAAVLRQQAISWHDCSFGREVRYVLRRVQGPCWDLVHLHDLFGCLLPCPVLGRCSHCERSGRTCTSQRHRSGAPRLSETEKRV